MQWTPFLLVFLGVEIALSEEDSKCLGILPAERVRCGDPGTNERVCVDKGCCFDDTVQDPFVPWCFFARPLPPPPPSEGPTRRPSQMPSQMSRLKCIGIPPEERQRCGYQGIKRELCEYKGCCFRHAVKGPECFHGRPMMPPHTEGPSMGSSKGPTKGPSSKTAPMLA